jgi:hypothetical protein
MARIPVELRNSWNMLQDYMIRKTRTKNSIRHLGSATVNGKYGTVNVTF